MTNSMSFHCLEWFPGWQHPKNYNRQPNDDGLSKQDCVEIRRHFLRPDSSTEFLTDSFMWNDRGCSTRNFFICERPLIDGKFYFPPRRHKKTTKRKHFVISFLFHSNAQSLLPAALRSKTVTRQSICRVTK